MEQPIICTIIAKNYLAHARTLCGSFLAHHPTGRCYVLIIDEHTDFIDPSSERFELVTLSDISLPERQESFCFKYDVTELATAVKPFFLRWLLETRGESIVLYLDPDILVTAPLDHLYARLHSGSGLLLTPHLESDYPDDGLLPNDAHILTSGVFNLGFLGVRAGNVARKFLPWLENKLADRCVIAPEHGLFVDQKFFDLVPSLFPEEHDVERSPGFNAAYWNLHSRTLEPDPTSGSNRWRCNGTTLCFFHFSAYKVERPGEISSHQTRFRLQDRPDLQPIFAFYHAHLLQHGYEQTQRWPYSYARFKDGRVISKHVRRYFRRWKLTEPMADPFASPRLRKVAVLLDAVDGFTSWGEHTRGRTAIAFRRLLQRR